MDVSRKHYFFDMDGTLTPSRSACSVEMRKAIFRLAKKADVTIVSGARYKQVKKQLPFLPSLRFYVLSQSGNDARWWYRKLWKRKLRVAHKTIISEHIRVLKAINPHDVFDPKEIVEDRGGQVSYSLIGHNAPLEVKKSFDPDGEKRRKLLAEFPLTSTAVQVRIGGTTCLDYTATGWGKAGNIGELMKREDWRIEDCYYVGDALFPGGNDHEMLAFFGPSQCRSVLGPDETLSFIKSLADVN